MMRYIKLVCISCFKSIVVTASGDIPFVTHEIVLYLIALCSRSDKAPVICTRRNVDKLFLVIH